LAIDRVACVLLPASAQEPPMTVREPPLPTRDGDCVSFAALLPVTGHDEPAHIVGLVRNWVRSIKDQMMRSFAVLDTYGKDAAYVARVVQDGPPSFSAHTGLGRLGFRLDSGKGKASYTLPLLSNWKADTAAAAFEHALEVLIPRALPLERCREIAADFVACFARSFNFGLDYSAASLTVLSRAVIQRESHGLSPVVYLPTTVVGAGCYLGEVLIREVGSSAWMEHEDEIHCNFMLGLVPFNPWVRMLDLCVRGSEATLAGKLKETLFVRSTDAAGEREAGPWATAWD
jgi:hypothetical protein